MNRHKRPLTPIVKGSHKLSPERVLFGIHAVEAAFANPKRTIVHAYLTKNALSHFRTCLDQRHAAFTEASPEGLDALLGSRSVHQGVVLEVEPLAQPRLSEFLDALDAERPVALALLDQVTDPHNIGAVLRSAAAFGITALIVQDRHCPPLTGALAKAASGAVEYVPVMSEVNLARAMTALKAHGFVCAGFDSDAASVFSWPSADTDRVAFCFGAEDKGLRRLVRESCDQVFTLNVPGPIKSLNVSNAAAIVFQLMASCRSGNQFENRPKQ